jgi:hypothetical protein
MFSWDFSRFRESIIILEKVGSNQFSPSATHVQIARKVFRIFQSNQARNFAGSLNQLQLKSTSIHALSDLASVKSLLFARYVNESFQTSWSRSIRVALCVSFFVCSNAALLGQLITFALIQNDHWHFQSYCLNYCYWVTWDEIEIILYILSLL